uniref:Uncharacterized protein n=1 Tax=mine drainage metagenome TaxID=410659 RepID=E6PK31_9ZZZZ
MGDRLEATHKAPPPVLPHGVGEVRKALREFEGCPPGLPREVGEVPAPPHAWGGVGSGSDGHGCGKQPSSFCHIARRCRAGAYVGRNGTLADPVRMAMAGATVIARHRGSMI